MDANTLMPVPKITRTFLDNLYKDLCANGLEIHDLWQEDGQTYLSFRPYEPDLFDDGTRYIMFFFGYLPQP